MNRRMFAIFLFLVWAAVATSLSLPLHRQLTISPGTTMGFDFSETTVFEFLSLTGPLDCLSYNFTSTKQMNAAIWFETWDYIKEYVVNNTSPPLHQGVVPNSQCNKTTNCGVNFDRGELPGIDPRIRSSFAPVPYAVVFWYPLDYTGDNNVSLTVDTPCYTGETEIINFPPVPVAAPSTNNNSTSSP